MAYTIKYKSIIFQVSTEVYLGRSKSGKPHWMTAKYETLEDAEKKAMERFEKESTEWVEIRKGNKVIKRMEK